MRIGVDRVEIEERSLHCVARRTQTARKKKPGYSRRDDSGGEMGGHLPSQGWRSKKSKAKKKKKRRKRTGLKTRHYTSGR